MKTLIFFRLYIPVKPLVLGTGHFYKTKIVSFCSGLVYKRRNQLEDALDCFQKLQAILRNHPQVLYQIANLYPFLFFLNVVKC